MPGPASLNGDPFEQFYEQARYASLDEEEQRIYDRSLMDYWDIYAIEKRTVMRDLRMARIKGARRGFAEANQTCARWNNVVNGYETNPRWSQ